MKEKDLKKIYIVEQLNYEKKLVKDFFEEAGIDYIFLKGAFIRDLYTNPWERISADVDVLVREEDYQRAKSVLESHGHKIMERDEHGITFINEYDTQLDLHVNAIPPKRKGYEVALRAWDSATLVPDTKHEYRLTPDMLYFIHIAHVAKHFVMGGGNIYSIKDVIYIEKEYGKGLARDLLREAGLLEFAEKIEEIATASENALPQNTLSDDAKAIRDVILEGDLRGSARNSEIGWIIKTGGGINYYYRRLFPPVWNMKYFYPVLKKFGGIGILLLPACYIHRIIKAFTSGVWKRKADEVKQKTSITKEDIKERKELLERYNLI